MATRTIGPGPRERPEKENAFTPKVGISFQPDPNNLYYATYAKGFRPGGGNAPLPAFCAPGLTAEGYPNGQAPLDLQAPTRRRASRSARRTISTTRCASRPASTTSSGTTSSRTSTSPAACGLQFTDNLGTAVAKGFDMQAEMALGGGLSLDASVGYTSARYTQELAHGGLALRGRCDLGRGGDQLQPGHQRAVDRRDRARSTTSRSRGHDAFVRLDWEYTSPQPVARGGPGSGVAQYNPNAPRCRRRLSPRCAAV